MAVQRRPNSVTINAAFLEEIKEVNEELWNLLATVRQICGHAERIADQGRAIADLLGEVRDQLAMHFALEEAYGYFDDPVHVTQRVSDLADALREEHKTLYTHIRDLADDADAMDRSGTLAHQAGRVGERFRAFDERLQEHERREYALIQESRNGSPGGDE